MQNKQPLKCFVSLNYHDELETTTQDELGMNRLRVNTQMFFFCVGTFIEGLLIIFIVKWYQIPFNLTDMG